MKQENYKYRIGDEIKSGNFHGIILDTRRNKDGRKSYKYKCLKCGYDQGEKTEISIEKGFGCLCCANRVVVKGINDIPTTDPWMVKFFQGGYEEASKYSRSCGKLITPICPYCGRTVTRQTVNSLYRHNGVSCVCKDGISFPNKVIYFLMEQLLKHNKISHFQREYRIPSHSKWFDMYFEKNQNKYFIEMDGGIGHGDIIKKHQKNKDKNFKFYPVSMFRNDVMKDRIAEEMQIPLIRIDCYYSDFSYIKTQILRSDLNYIVNLQDIDWDTVEECSYSNLVKKVCEFKKENPEAFVKDAVSKFHLSAETIRTYWDRGNRLGWCQFDRESEHTRSRHARTYYGQSCPIIMTNTATGAIFSFDSVADFIRKNDQYFSIPLTRKRVQNLFKKNNDSIENYEGYTIQKLRRNCDGVCKSR